MNTVEEEEDAASLIPEKTNSIIEILIHTLSTQIQEKLIHKIIQPLEF